MRKTSIRNQLGAILCNFVISIDKECSIQEHNKKHD